MYVPLSDREFLWNQLVDTIDNYFQIEREERVRLVGGVLTEGQIETFPLPGATIFEPWPVVPDAWPAACRCLNRFG